MSEKSSALSDAPPINAPSTFDKDTISFSLLAFTDPPYKIL